jgi:hypothetical protein
MLISTQSSLKPFKFISGIISVPDYRERCIIDGASKNCKELVEVRNTEQKLGRNIGIYAKSN